MQPAQISSNQKTEFCWNKGGTQSLKTHPRQQPTFSSSSLPLSFHNLPKQCYQLGTTWRKCHIRT